MNKKHFIIGLILLFSASSYGQVQNNMNRLVTQCGKIVEYSQQITELKGSINNVILGKKLVMIILHLKSKH